MGPLSSCWRRSSGSFIRGGQHFLIKSGAKNKRRVCGIPGTGLETWAGLVSTTQVETFVRSHQVIKAMSLIRMWQKDLCQYCQQAARDYSQIFNRSQIPNSQFRLNCQYPVFILVLTELPAASFLKGHRFLELGLNHFHVNTCVRLSPRFFLRLFAQWPFQLVRKNNSFWFIPMEWVRPAGTPTKEPWKVDGLSRVDFPHAVTFDLQRGRGKKNTSFCGAFKRVVKKKKKQFREWHVGGPSGCFLCKSSAPRGVRPLMSPLRLAWVTPFPRLPATFPKGGPSSTPPPDSEQVGKAGGGRGKRAKPNKRKKNPAA